MIGRLHVVGAGANTHQASGVHLLHLDELNVHAPAGGDALHLGPHTVQACSGLNELVHIQASCHVSQLGLQDLGHHAGQILGVVQHHLWVHDLVVQQRIQGHHGIVSRDDLQLGEVKDWESHGTDCVH